MGGTWEKVSGDLTRGIDQNTLPMMGKMWPPEAVAKNMSTSKFGNIFALSESPLKQGMLYAGTDDGLIWITENDGESWTKFDVFPGVPEMTFVNYITPSMHNEATFYACFDGRKNSSDFTPYLIKSTDKGQPWTSIAANLPSGTFYCIQEDHVNPDILFIGTEWGVWTTIDRRKKWVQLKNGIPPIQVKELTRLVEPQSFKVTSIPNALGTPDYEASFNFIKNANDLNTQVTAAQGKIADMNTRIKNMQPNLENLPVEANVLVKKIETIQKEIDAVTKIISGGFGAKNTVSSRLRGAIYTTYSAQVDVTGAQKEQYNLAKEAFTQEVPKLNNLFKVKLPALEKEYEAAGGVLFINSPTRSSYYEE